MTVMDYDETNLLEQEIETIEECFPFKDQPSVTWIHIEGIHQENVIDAIGKHFGVHPLVLEDLINMGQRPKMEVYENYIFIVLRMLCYDDENADVEDKQVGLIVGSDFVVSVLETGGDTFKEIRERIRSGQGRVRKMRADYLVYALMDITVDNYFIILEKLADQIELIEEELVTNPTPHTLQKIYHMKRMMIRMRKSVWPLREVVSKMERGESDLFTQDTQIYLRDLYDHTLEVIEAVELLREMVSSMLDMYLSSISHK
jgi:magnesium transporter